MVGLVTALGRSWIASTAHSVFWPEYGVGRSANGTWKGEGTVMEVTKWKVRGGDWVDQIEHGKLWGVWRELGSWLPRIWGPSRPSSVSWQGRAAMRGEGGRESGLEKYEKNTRRRWNSEEKNKAWKKGEGGCWILDQNGRSDENRNWRTFSHLKKNMKSAGCLWTWELRR